MRLPWSSVEPFWPKCREIDKKYFKTNTPFSVFSVLRIYDDVCFISVSYFWAYTIQTVTSSHALYTYMHRSIHQYIIITIPNGFDNLTQWSLEKMTAISQTTFSHVFSWMKMFTFRSKFHWSLLPNANCSPHIYHVLFSHISPLQWHHMSVKASQTADNSNVCSIVCFGW